MEILMKKTGINGEGIGYINKKPVFVPQALQGELCEVEVVEEKERYAIGKLIKVIQPSEHRIAPACPYAKVCGGCSLAMMDETWQLKIKQDLLKEALWKYAKISESKVERLFRSPYRTGYRNQCKMPLKNIDGKIVSGLYQEGSNQFIAIDHCLIHDAGLEKVRKQVLEVLNKHQMKADEKRMPGIKTLVLRRIQNKTQCCLVTSRIRIPQACVDDLLKIETLNSLSQNINDDRKSRDLFGKIWNHLGGYENMVIDVCGKKLKLSAASFFQLNTFQAERMVNTVAEVLEPCGTLVEAYCGVGLMSIAASDKFEKGIGIEVVKEAIVNAKENARINRLKHLSFVCGDAAKELKKIAQNEKIDALVVDPPRSGLDDAMLKAIMQCLPTQIVYVSCNPATLSKNLAVLTSKYNVELIQPLDMFPQTPHVECIVKLKRK